MFEINVIKRIQDFDAKAFVDHGGFDEPLFPDVPALYRSHVQTYRWAAVSNGSILGILWGISYAGNYTLVCIKCEDSEIGASAKKALMASWARLKRQMTGK